MEVKTAYSMPFVWQNIKATHTTANKNYVNNIFDTQLSHAQLFSIFRCYRRIRNVRDQIKYAYADDNNNGEDACYKTRCFKKFVWMIGSTCEVADIDAHVMSFQ
jgi:hypothetical protein